MWFNISHICSYRILQAKFKHLNKTLSRLNEIILDRSIWRSYVSHDLRNSLPFDFKIVREEYSWIAKSWIVPYISCIKYLQDSQIKFLDRRIRRLNSQMARFNDLISDLTRSLTIVWFADHRRVTIFTLHDWTIVH